MLDNAGWHADEVDHFAFHQPSRAVLEKIFAELGAKPDAGVHTHGLFGNTASTAWALALDHRLRTGTVAAGTRSCWAARRRVHHRGGDRGVGRRCGRSRWRCGPGCSGRCGVRSASRYLQLYRTISKTFGTRLRPVGTFAALQVRQGISAATMGLDRLVYPQVADQPIDRPIFIVGNPRSGTTFCIGCCSGPGTPRLSSCGR